MSKHIYIKEEQIGKIDTFLCRAYNTTKNGYVKTSMSGIARNANITVKISETLKAVRNLNILKQSGARRSAMWHWNGIAPDIDMAEKVYNEIKRISLNNSIEKAASERAKSKGLVPIVGSTRPSKTKKTKVSPITRERVVEIIDEMISNIGTLFMLEPSAAEHGVNVCFFTPLIELDIIQPYNRIPGGFYKLIEIKQDNKSVIVDLIVDSYNSEQKPKRKNNDINTKAEAVFTLLKFLDRNPHNGSMATILKDLNLAPVYLTIAARLGYIINTGNGTKPVYQLVGMPNISMAQEITVGVRDYWNKKPRNIEPVPQVSTTPVVTNVPVSVPTDNDLNGMLDRAIKRKEYLILEMAKVNKIIESANAIKKLTLELNN